MFAAFVVHNSLPAAPASVRETTDHDDTAPLVHHSGHKLCDQSNDRCYIDVLNINPFIQVKVNSFGDEVTEANSSS
jgi:hypothetical protein